MVDRYSFHLENAAGEELGEVLEQFCLEYYGVAPSIPPQLVVPRGAGDTSALEAFLSELRGSRVEVRAPERGEKRRLQELAQQNAAARASTRRRSSPRRSGAPRRGARGAARGAEPRVAADPHRVLRHLEHPGPGDRRLDGRLRGRRGEEDRITASSRCGRLDGQDDFAAMREVIARRFSRLGGRRRLGGVERVVRRDAEPRRDRRRQGSALGRARCDAGARAAARRGDLARETDRGGLRSRPQRADPAAARLAGACSCCSASATRRTASRSRSTASAATSRRVRRCSTSSTASARCGGARCCSTSARPSASSRRRRRSSKACPACHPRRRAGSTRSCTGPGVPEPAA